MSLSYSTKDQGTMLKSQRWQSQETTLGLTPHPVPASSACLHSVDRSDQITKDLLLSLGYLSTCQDVCLPLGHTHACEALFLDLRVLGPADT